MDTILRVGDQCTGCYSCVNSCPTDAIRMEEDLGGFRYPVIADDRCVNCGKCVTVCPIESNEPLVDRRVKAYYGAAKHTELVKRSSSGGAFSLMAEYVLSQNGLVCGAVIDYDTMDIIYADTDHYELDALRRSKYVASLPKAIFGRVKEELQKDRLVLFCGLPCHVDGLQHFLKKDYQNLITCDFICGGTASPRFFKEHIELLEKRYHAKVADVNFRAKLNGWKEHSIKVTFANGKEYRSVAFFDSFFKGYFEKPFQRNSCYQCRYRLAHASDVIIADYWGGLRKGRANDGGVSMVITNSSKGDNFVSAVLSNGDHTFVEMPLTDSDYVFKTEEERYSKALVSKKAFMQTYQAVGFEKAAKKTYFKGVGLQKCKRKIHSLLSKMKRR